MAEALGLPFVEKEIDYGPLARLANVLLGASFAGLATACRGRLVAPWPDLVIAAGRRTAPVSRRIKKLGHDRTFAVHIMHPGAGAAAFDLLALPNHDGARAGANAISITGAPHPVTPERLAEARDRWGERLRDLPRPRIALVVGGSTRRRRFTGTMAEELAATASRIANAAGGSLMVTTSRRTGAAAAPLIAAIAAPARIYRWGDAGENPYLGFLGLADAVVVTGESVSMCSEACAAPVPVYLYAPPALVTKKHARLHAELFEKGYARPLAGRLESWTHPPLNAAFDIAAEIRRRLGL